ncbi:restriction endonuclease subunit S [Xanthobacter sp. V0B-10]|uniref:restriction endonuclease subunit S n=1 Tax=Xanthobacter albus TaxID=3119929 RepID=UPI00372756B9
MKSQPDWRTEKLGDIARFKTGKLDSNAAVLDGKYPFFTCSQETLRTNTFSFDTECVLLAGNNAAGIFPLKYFDGKFDAYQRTYIITPLKKDILHIRFLYYSLRLKLSEFRSISTGAATKFLTLGILNEAQIRIPSLKIQRRIASILGAYDDLIEVNRRRIAVLEEMARGLFEEWFVRFRFPGHEVLPIEDTPDGSLPTGWSWGTASDLLLFDPRTRVPREGEKPFIPMGHLDTSTSLIAEPETRDGNSGSKFQNGDTLFARITPCLENGKTGLVRNLPGPDGVGFGSTEFIVMRGGRAGPAFTYCLSRLPAFRDHARMSMSGASGRQRARTDSVADFVIAIPPMNNLFDLFEKAAWPMLELVGQIGSSNERLAASRDLLLPRLISGQLSVAQAERELEAA